MEKDTSLIRLPILELFLVSITISYWIYSVFFHFSEQIWAGHQRVDPMQLTMSIRQWVNEYDGIEAYVLYLAALMGMGLVSVFSFSKKAQSRLFLKYLILLLGSFLFFKSVGFNPPMPAIAKGGHLILAYVFVCAGLLIVKKLMTLSHSYSDLLIMIGLVPICFVATSRMSLLDYSFIFSPAYRLLHQAKLQDLYLQYDLLMTAFAYLWMKMGLALNHFQVIPRFSMYLFVLGLFAYARRMFDKPLAYWLLLSLIIIKIYAPPNGDLAASIQLTPLRLDLWLILLFIAAQRGIYSPFIGFALGWMVLVNHNFGQFYVLSYTQVLFVLFLLDAIDLKRDKQPIFPALFKKHFYLALPNLICIMIGLLLYYFFFKHFISESVRLYKFFGIGFLRVSNTSFYWYILVLTFTVFAVLIRKRKALPAHYFTSGLFLLFLGLGNSLYFLGRSHEWNILNIASVFLLILFLLFDLLKRTYTANPFMKIAPLLFIGFITYYYSERITNNVITQATNMVHGRLEYPMSQAAPFEKQLFKIDALQSLTKHSQKVFVLSYLYDFYYYYYGQYKPRGHFFPYYSWPLKKELAYYLQKLLDKGFYLVIPEEDALAPNKPLEKWEVEGHKEELSALVYSQELEKDGFRVIWK